MGSATTVCITGTDSLSRCTPVPHLAHTQKAALSDQIREFSLGLFDTDLWPARWYCGSWSDFHGWFFILSDLLIWLAYFLIPVFLIRVLKHRKDLPFSRTIWLFVLFIVFCGSTHFIDAVIFWFPVYRFAALMRFLTAVVSLSTVFYLYRLFPQIIQLRTINDLQQEIDERNMVEEKLEASEYLLNAAGEVGRLAGWEYDLANDQFKWTKTAERLFKSSRRNVSTLSQLLDYFDEEDGVLIQSIFANVKRSTEAIDYEVMMHTDDGAAKWIRFSASGVVENEGRIRIMGIIMDIDRYKNAEFNLIRSVEQMGQQNTQLKNFTHILSHNLRNHSGNISLLTSFIDETTLDEANLEVVAKIRTVSGHLNNTLQDLSQIIRIRENQLEAEPLDMLTVTRHVTDILDQAIRESGAQIRIDYQEKTVHFPRIYLESILINLISNGIKYRKDHEPPRIALRFYMENQQKVLEYEDHGQGIDLALHGDKVFGLYQTFHAHREAHGVGLFLVKNQIEAQGGKIQAFSTPGEGITFKITFNENA